MGSSAITFAAFEAIGATSPFGSVAYEAERDTKGTASSGWKRAIVECLAAMRGQGESYSEVILRLAAIEARGA
jgi:hypothetical protein